MSPLTQSPDLIGHAGSTGAFAFYEPNKDLYLVGTFNQIDNPARPFRFMPRVVSTL
jgi:CubicO group peptidase (beta-lactamase class C family)